MRNIFFGIRLPFGCHFCFLILPESATYLPHTSLFFSFMFLIYFPNFYIFLKEAGKTAREGHPDHTRSFPEALDTITALPILPRSHNALLTPLNTSLKYPQHTLGSGIGAHLNPNMEEGELVHTSQNHGLLAQ